MNRRVLSLLGVLAVPRRARDPAWLLAMLPVAMPALFLLAYKIRFAYSSNQDARPWAPAFFPLALLTNWG